MSNTVKILIGLAVGFVVMIMVIIGSLVGTNNKYVQITAQHEQQQTNLMNVLDNMRNSVREAAQISDKEVAALRDIIVGTAEARGPGPQGGSGVISMAMVQEAVPSITSIETLRNLQNILSSSRTNFMRQQTMLLDIERQGNVMYRSFPSGVVLKMFGHDPLSSVIITSSETRQNFETGVSDGSWLD